MSKTYDANTDTFTFNFEDKPAIAENTITRDSWDNVSFFNCFGDEDGNRVFERAFVRQNLTWDEVNEIVEFEGYDVEDMQEHIFEYHGADGDYYKSLLCVYFDCGD